ncbi:pyridoxamine 5'-phosphate oxidase family protein [Gordonia zhaorongruii]|uniref:pyridoxamine 5'-phosphate oxidase family protein n=1 Tax=Gordonia zhaorongruii TaxID=2597659 RepID=UPI0010432495|nr:pyridoxamine 5'-phosphate oxidase family protein [Gordonia zhaorongruii]
MGELTEEQIDEFLRALHVGVLSIERKSNPPLAVPIWYDVNDDGDIIMFTGETAFKAKLIEKASRASYTVQQESLPYTYVTVEGRATVEPVDEATILRIAVRYLGEEEGAKFVKQGGGVLDSVLITVHRDRVRSFTYGG